MAKDKKEKKKSGAKTADFGRKKKVKKRAKKADAPNEDVGGGRESKRSLGQRLDQGLETLASELRSVSTGLETHVNAIKFDARKQVEAVKTEAARELQALKSDMAKQIEVARSEAAGLVEAVKSEAAAQLAEARKASDQAMKTLKAELDDARTEIAKAIKPSGGPARSRSSETSGPSRTGAKRPAKAKPTPRGGAPKGDPKA